MKPQPEPTGTGTLLPALCAVIGAAVAVRVGAALFLGNTVAPLPGVYDQISYHTLALRVLGGHGFTFAEGWWPATPANEPTAHWSFLYTGLLAGVYAVTGANPLIARLLQAVVLGVLHPLLTYRLGARLFGERVGLVSAAIAAGYAYFVYYSAALVTEGLFIVALLWAFDAASRLADAASGRRAGRARWAELGAALAVAILLRQAIVLVVPLVLGWAWWRAAIATPPGGERLGALRLAGGVGTAVMVIALSIAPWTIRNWAAFHELVPLNTNAGFAFFWGNHPVHGNGFIPILPGPEYGRLIPQELKGLNEARLDRALMGRAFQVVAADPVRFLRVSVSRIPEYVKFWPSRDSGTASNLARVLSFGVWLPFMACGIWLAASRRAATSGGPGSRSLILLILGVASVYSLVHLLTWTLVRYRLPMDAVLVPFAGLSAAWVLDWIARSSRPLRLAASHHE